MIWFNPSITPEMIQSRSANSMVDHLDIRITAITDESLWGEMPVDARTVQPMRRLHGGASAALAETLGSIAALLTVNPEEKSPVGLSLNIQHIRGVRENEGPVRGKATPIHLGGSTQVWSIVIFDPQDRLVANAQLTVSLLQNKK